ncbi:MAG TPA: hypothetical protein VMT94_07860, partial [Burkholderiales bacterium]|nr:hypothetical protein [Burkholderiales bacterium]
KNGEIALIVNTVEERKSAVRDSYAIRRAALQEQITLYTTLAGVRAACTGMRQSGEIGVYPLQDLHAQLAAPAPQPDDAHHAARVPE